jgi:hypothetical protein
VQQNQSLPRRSSFEAQNSYAFMQQAAAQGHPRASVCFSLSRLHAAENDLDIQAAFDAMMVQAMRSFPAAQYCVGELICCGCAHNCRSVLLLRRRLLVNNASCLQHRRSVAVVRTGCQAAAHCCFAGIIYFTSCSNQMSIAICCLSP